MNQQVCNIAGIALNMIGSCLVAYEIVVQYRGEKYRSVRCPNDLNDNPLETPEFTAWQLRKYKFMAFGLALIMLGGIFQLFGMLQ